MSQALYVVKIGGSSLNDRAMEAMTQAGIEPKLSSFIYALAFVCINFIPALILYRKKIFIKL